MLAKILYGGDCQTNAVTSKQKSESAFTTILAADVRQPWMSLLLM